MFDNAAMGLEQTIFLHLLPINFFCGYRGEMRPIFPQKLSPSLNHKQEELIIFHPMMPLLIHLIPTQNLETMLKSSLQHLRCRQLWTVLHLRLKRNNCLRDTVNYLRVGKLVKPRLCTGCRLSIFMMNTELRHWLNSPKVKLDSTWVLFYHIQETGVILFLRSQRGSQSWIIKQFANWK